MICVKNSTNTAVKGQLKIKKAAANSGGFYLLVI